MKWLLNIFVNFVDNVNKISGVFSDGLVFLMMVLVLFEVFMRYVMKNPPMISDEFCAYMLVAVSFIPIAQAWREKAHVRVTFLVDMLPKVAQSWLRMITLILGLFFAGLMTIESISYLEYSFKLRMASSTLYHTPLQIPIMALPIGFMMLTFLMVIEVVKTIKSIKSYKS